MNEEDCRFCVFPDLQDNSNNFSVVNWLLMVTCARIRPLLLSKYSKDVNIQNSLRLVISHRMTS